MGRRVRPHRYARRRLDFQLAAYRLLVFDICFPFVELIEKTLPRTFQQDVRYFFEELKSVETFSHTPGNVKGENVERGTYIN